MLAYAAKRPIIVDRRPHPNAMLAIVAVHVAVIAAVMSAKMEFQRHHPERPIIVETIPLPPTPQAHQVQHPAHPQTGPTVLRDPLPLPTPRDPFFPAGPTASPDPGPGPGTGPVALHDPVPKPVMISSGPQLLTPASELRPPYPPSKLLNEEEAVLRLKLTIDANGRVIAVDPVGRTDAAFLEAARRHLLAHWRYKPASEDGRAVISSSVITLRFELNG
jgi:protein TonB